MEDTRKVLLELTSAKLNFIQYAEQRQRYSELSESAGRMAEYWEERIDYFDNELTKLGGV